VREADAGKPGCAELRCGLTAVPAVAGSGVGHLDEDIGAVEAELPGGPHDLVAGVGGQDAGDLRDLGVVYGAEQVVGGLEFPACGDAADLAGGVVREQAGDQARYAPHGQEGPADFVKAPFPLLDAGIDEQCGQRLAVLAEDDAQRGRAVPLQDLSGVLAVERGRLEVAGERAEDAVGADGGFAAGGVGVERDEDPGAGQVGGLAELGGLLAGQCGAAGCQPGVMAGVGDADGDGVEGAFRDDGDGSPGRDRDGPGASRTAGGSCCRWRPGGC
jgi:hypothetical protein